MLVPTGLGRAGRAGGQDEGVSLPARPQLVPCQRVGSRAPSMIRWITHSVRVQRIKRKKRSHGRAVVMETGNVGEPKASPLVAQTGKNPPAMQETQFSPSVRKIPWRREWIPTPVFLPGKSHGQRSLGGYIPRVAKNRTRLSG